MSNQIGFIILSHTCPSQLLRLLLTLQRVYDRPPIVCHHDFTQSPLFLDEFPSDVRFVLPHIKTRWGRISVVDAGLRALKLLYQNSAPDWFVLLSAADYPTMRAEKVLEELKSSGMDALLDYREVRKIPIDTIPPAPENPALQHFVSPGNLTVSWHRYVGLNVSLPIIRSGPRIARHILYPPFKALRSPFGPQFKCFYGDHWFAGNQKAANILLRPTSEHIRLRRYLYWRASADECYYHTVLGNAHDLKISTATRRFAEWQGGGAHPQILGLDDLPAIVSSKAYFARKFAPDSQALDEIDKTLL